MACSEVMEDCELARFRTKMCQRHVAEGCEFRRRCRCRCQYSHNILAQRRCPFLLFNKEPLSILRYIPVLCHETTLNYTDGESSWSLMQSDPSQCPRGAGCPFAHSIEEILFHPLIYKQKLCLHYHDRRGASSRVTNDEGVAPFCPEYYCPFVHNTEEKRHVPISRYKLAPSIVKRIQPEMPRPLDLLATAVVSSGKTSDSWFCNNTAALQELLLSSSAPDRHHHCHSSLLASDSNVRFLSCSLTQGTSALDQGSLVIVSSVFHQEPSSVFDHPCPQLATMFSQDNVTLSSSDASVAANVLSVMPGDVVEVLVDSLSCCSQSHSSLSEKALKMSSFLRKSVLSEECEYESVDGALVKEVSAEPSLLTIGYDGNGSAAEYNKLEGTQSPRYPRLLFVKCVSGSAFGRTGWIPASIIFGFDETAVISKIQFEWSSQYFAELLDRASATQTVRQPPRDLVGSNALYLESSDCLSERPSVSAVLPQGRTSTPVPRLRTPLAAASLPNECYTTPRVAAVKSAQPPPRVRHTVGYSEFSKDIDDFTTRRGSWRDQRHCSPPSETSLRQMLFSENPVPSLDQKSLPNLLEGQRHMIPPPPSHVYDKHTLLWHRTKLSEASARKPRENNIPLPCRARSCVSAPRCPTCSQTMLPSNPVFQDARFQRDQLLQKLLQAEQELQQCIAVARVCSSSSPPHHHQQQPIALPHLNYQAGPMLSNSEMFPAYAPSPSLLDSNDFLPNHILEKILQTLQVVQELSGEQQQQYFESGGQSDDNCTQVGNQHHVYRQQEQTHPSSLLAPQTPIVQRAITPLRGLKPLRKNRISTASTECSGDRTESYSYDSNGWVTFKEQLSVTPTLQREPTSTSYLSE